MIERTVYEDILPRLPCSTLRYYGFVPGGPKRGDWLFLEDAAGDQYSSLIDEHRQLAARWLGLLHVTAADLGMPPRLPQRGAAHYWQQLLSSRKTISDNLANPVLKADDIPVLHGILSQFEVLESRWSWIESVCNQMPQTLVHGDFAGKNIRIRKTRRETVLLPFDWEMAGWGTPAVDLSQLIRVRGIEQRSVLLRFDSLTAEQCGPAVDLVRLTADSVSKQIATYLSIVQSRWPLLTVRELRLLARIGTMFRVIQSIGWELCGTVFDRTSHARRPDENVDPQWTMSALRTYRIRMDDALRIDQWTPSST